MRCCPHILTICLLKVVLPEGLWKCENEVTDEVIFIILLASYILFIVYILWKGRQLMIMETCSEREGERYHWEVWNLIVIITFSFVLSFLLLWKSWNICVFQFMNTNCNMLIYPVAVKSSLCFSTEMYWQKIATKFETFLCTVRVWVCWLGYFWLLHMLHKLHIQIRYFVECRVICRQLCVLYFEMLTILMKDFIDTICVLWMSLMDFAPTSSITCLTDICTNVLAWTHCCVHCHI